MTVLSFGDFLEERRKLLFEREALRLGVSKLQRQLRHKESIEQQLRLQIEGQKRINEAREATEILKRSIKEVQAQTEEKKQRCKEVLEA